MFLSLIVSININFSWITNKKKIQHLHPFIYSSLFPPRIHLRHRPEEATMLLNDSNKVITSDTELLRTIKDSFQESKCLIVLSGRHLFLEFKSGNREQPKNMHGMDTGVYWYCTAHHRLSWLRLAPLNAYLLCLCSHSHFDAIILISSEPTRSTHQAIERQPHDWRKHV